MGGAASTRPIPSGDIPENVKVVKNDGIQHAMSSSDAKEMADVSAESLKLTSPELKQLALGDSSSPKHGQNRDYNRKLSNMKRRQCDIEWSDATTQLPDDKKSTRTSPSVKKFPESSVCHHQPPTKKPPPPASKPKPPSSGPNHMIQRKPIGHNVVYAPTNKAIGRTGVGADDNRLQNTYELSRDERDHKPSINVMETEVSQESYIDSFNVLGNGHSPRSDSESECYDDQDSYLYDWTSSDTPRLNKTPDARHGCQHSTGQGASSGSLGGGGDLGDCLWTDSVITRQQQRPDNVPRLTIPSQCLSAGSPPPKQPRPVQNPSAVNKPSPPPKHMQGLSVSTAKNQSPTAGMSTCIHRGTPMTRHPPHTTPPIRVTPGLGGSGLFPEGSQRSYIAQPHHEVKETKDVKRNKAQLPSTLTHAKPTTGDWLKKRHIVNNYILLDILGTGSYGEVSDKSAE